MPPGVLVFMVSAAALAWQFLQIKELSTASTKEPDVNHTEAALIATLVVLCVVDGT